MCLTRLEHKEGLVDVGHEYLHTLRGVSEPHATNVKTGPATTAAAAAAAARARTLLAMKPGTFWDLVTTLSMDSARATVVARVSGDVCRPAPRFTEHQERSFAARLFSRRLYPRLSHRSS